MDGEAGQADGWECLGCGGARTGRRANYRLFSAIWAASLQHPEF